MAYYKVLSATAQQKIGAGKLFGLVVSSTSSGTIAIYDSKSASTSDPKMLDTWTPSAGQVMSFPPGMWFSNGLYIVVSSTISFTVVYE